MTEITALLLDLFVLYAAARIGGELFERFRQPAMAGEILAGAVIGPHALGLTGLPDAALIATFGGDPAAASHALRLVHELLAELGVVVLLFFVGLETPVAAILRVGGRALLVAVAGVALPLGLGLGAAALLDYTSTEALFLGSAMVATSVGMTARVLRDLGVLDSIEARIILGAAVIDDILGLMILSVVTGISSTGRFDAFEAAAIAVQAVAFTLFVVLAGVGAVRRLDLHLERLRIENPALSVALLTMLGLAAAAGLFGLAAIVGAFLTGMVFAEARQQSELRRQTLPIFQLLAPFFFVITGSQLDLGLLLEVDVLGLAAGITALALVGKVAGCALPVIGMGRRSMLIVGIGMAPRGEVGLIVASLGLRLGAFPTELFNVIVFMSIVTALIAPPCLRPLYRRQASADTGSD